MVVGDVTIGTDVLIDGTVGARFTNAVMEYLENPDLLLLE